MINPSVLFSQMLQRNPNYKDNPIANNAMQMFQQGNVNGLKELADNLAKSKGVDIGEVRKSLGI